MADGVFVVFEGVEGSGKSTQAHRLADWLAARDVPFVLTREPGTTPLGEEVRAALLEREDVPARSELLLMLAARAALVEQIIRPALEAGRVVVSDRYELSTLAYQGHGRGLPLDDVRRLNAFATGGLHPHLTLLLDVPAADARARRSTADAREDRIERAGRAFHERVAEAYRLLADDGSWVERIDGTGSPDEVHRRVVRCLLARFPETLAERTG